MDTRFTPVADALRAGNRTEAVRLLREITGMSMSEANDAVDLIEADDPSIAAATALRESSGFARSDASATSSVRTSAGTSVGSGTASVADSGASSDPRTVDDASSALERSLRALREANAAGLQSMETQAPTSTAKIIPIIVLAILIAIMGLVLTLFVAV